MSIHVAPIHMYVLMINKGIPSATCISGSVCETFLELHLFHGIKSKTGFTMHHCPLHGVYRRDFCVLFNQSSIQGMVTGLNPEPRISIVRGSW